MSTLLSLALLMACGGSGATPSEDPDGDPGTEPCPAPGPGVSVGGQAGGGLDTEANPTRRLVLMGGSSENDAASELFAEGAGGGDIVIGRASGSLTSYPNYFMSTLAPIPSPTTAVTVLTDDPTAGNDPAFICRLNRAEAVWLAGGDQWDYLGLWPAEVHAALAALAGRGAAVGGTSAGSAALGEAAFDAEHGSVTSDEALANPLLEDVSVSYPSFAQPELTRTLVDSHFMDRDREGRLMAFLAHFLEDRGHDSVLGLGLDERVAIVIEAGEYHVFSDGGGSAWLYEVTGPATLAAGTPLDLAGIRRVELTGGSQGAWPPDVGSMAFEEMSVVGGVIVTGSGG